MFGFGKQRFLGIDIGTSSIKIVEVMIGNKKPVLSNYAIMKIENSEVAQSDFSDEIFVRYVRRMFAKAKFKSKKAYVSMPAFGGLITMIEFPQMSDEDLDQAIRFEAHKYIPISLDDISLSWEILNRTKNFLIKEKGGADQDGGEPAVPQKLQVLLVAAPKVKVAKYQNIVRQVGLDLKSIEIESFSLLRSLIGNDAGNFILIDIGSRVCNIVLVEKGVIKVNRNIDAGGREITKIISKSMNIDESRAEKFKTSGKNILGDPSLKFATLDMIINEVRRVIGAYYKNDGDKKIDSLILSGGTAGFSDIEGYFFDALKIKTIIGNPLGRIDFDPKLEDKLKQIRPRLSVGVGLALRGAEEYLKNK